MVETKNNFSETIMCLIVYSGDAKSSAMEAIKFAKKGDFIEANKKLELTEEVLLKAHKTQSDLLTREAKGDTVQLSLLLIHGQDHLMNAITFKDMAIELVNVYKQLKEQEKR